MSQDFNCVSCCLNLARILLIFLIDLLLLLPLEAEVIEAVEFMVIEDVGVLIKQETEVDAGTLCT